MDQKYMDSLHNNPFQAWVYLPQTFRYYLKEI